MTSILVGIDGSTRGERALAWAARRAVRDGATLTLLTVIDPRAARESGATEQVAYTAAHNLLKAVTRELAVAFPQIEATTRIATGGIVDAVVDAAEGHDLIVLGSHHGASLRETVGGAKGLRVSVSTTVPTVVVPVDWDADRPGSGIVVGVGPDQVSENAIAFGVGEALATGERLELVSAWGLPPLLSRPAEAMGGGLAPVGVEFQSRLDERVRLLHDAHPGLDVRGRAVEAASPAAGIVAAARGHRLLVLGTHSRTVLGRALFGSVTHGVLLELDTPTVVVPQP
ncbi:universal stress protein [Pseudoclavibacter caeni]|jgi:nucleotide-binding universal stress UspA family protein|uniref:Universal stress protein n=1 Tax=Pseudoclavibacter caeni TaxID=908846 RepID=A0A7C8FPL3_9MICO|nr:universal stress protein [Pseudoclavibacter caeni]KAB1631513.1 universal stress protein [Pseudoclavibacter caeni]NYJ97843.1 nucleotide-binding universal stress UspA family protein [Pseudoclavibacter caeni]